LSPLVHAGHRDILLYGTGEVAEIAYLTMQELDLNLVGVIDSDAVRQKFFGYPVLDLSSIQFVPFDRLVIAAFESREKIYKQLVESGIPEAKLIVIPD
jgi:hypothetical protein